MQNPEIRSLFKRLVELPEVQFRPLRNLNNKEYSEAYEKYAEVNVYPEPGSYVRELFDAYPGIADDLTGNQGMEVCTDLTAAEKAEREVFSNKAHINLELPAFVQVSRKNVLHLHAYQQAKASPRKLLLYLEICIIELNAQLVYLRYDEDEELYDELVELKQDLIRLCIFIWWLTEKP